MDFFEVREEQILALMKGLQLIERLNPEKVAGLEMFLYGVTSDPRLLAEAKEVIMDYAEEYWDEEGRTTLSQEDLTLPEIAIAVPLSADAIYALMGSGIQVSGMDFAYKSGAGEGIRERRFINPSKGVRITWKSLKAPTLASSDINLHGYLSQHGTGQGMTVNEKAKRSEPAAIPVPKKKVPGELDLTAEDREFMGQLGVTGSNKRLEGLLDGFLNNGR